MWKKTIWATMLSALGVMGCASEVGSAESNLVVCESAVDGAACRVEDEELCATVTNAEGRLCECLDVPGSRTGAWSCFPAEPTGDDTCRDVVEGEICSDLSRDCVRGYEGFDVVCECAATPGSRRANTWQCHVVTTCVGPACDDSCVDAASCPSPGPACTDLASCDADCPSGDCGPADDDDCAGTADCGPVRDCRPGEDCDLADEDDCPPGADCEPMDECRPGDEDCPVATCMEREAALRLCETQYETCLAGPPSFVSCEDQLGFCVDAAPLCSSWR